MPRLAGTLYLSVALIGFAVLFYLTSVAGILFGGKSDPGDLGVYAVTAICLGLGGGGLLLRWTKLREEARVG